MSDEGFPIVLDDTAVGATVRDLDGRPQPPTTEAIIREVVGIYLAHAAQTLILAQRAAVAQVEPASSASA